MLNLVCVVVNIIFLKLLRLKDTQSLPKRGIKPQGQKLVVHT
jgi:hypothetical protein